MKNLMEIHPWKISTHVLADENQLWLESLTSISNGNLGMRGNFEEGYSKSTLQGIYLAGVWFPDKTRVGWRKNGYPEYFGKVVNAPNFIAVDIFVNDQKIDLAKVNYSDFYLELDLKTGVLSRSYQVKIEEAVLKISFKRFLSLKARNMSLQKIELKILSGAAKIKLISKIDGNVHNSTSNYDEFFWQEVARSKDKKILQVETKPNNFGTPRFGASFAMENKVTPKVAGIKAESLLKVSEEFEFFAKDGDTVSLEKRVAITTTREAPKESHEQILLEKISKSFLKSFLEMLEEHQLEWAKVWRVSDVEILGDAPTQQGVRFNLFQLLATYNGEDDRLNIGPKGFSGEKYGGGTYWDTESFVLPFYLTLADKQVAENLLRYRYEQLAEAKINARRQGLDGALFPVVTFTGIECHNEWEVTFEEIHRNGAVAHAIYNYTNYTGDERYLKTKGLKVLVEIARFWANRVHFNKRTGKFVIHGVTGPNEYENNVNNNWYTNLLAKWTLRYTIDCYYSYLAELDFKLGDDELNFWEEITNNIYLPYDEKLGIFVQNDNFLDKELKTVEDLNPEDLPLNQNWSWDKILRSPFIKQPDVLQGLFIFDNKFTPEEIRRNFEFYERFTVHESSLSPAVHAILAATIGSVKKALEFLKKTARLDLDNLNNDTQDGLHITSMAGARLAIIQGFAQMKTCDNRLSFAPLKPASWDKYAFCINYRQSLIKVEVEKTSVRLTLLAGSPLKLKIYQEVVTLTDKIEVGLK